MEISNGQHCTIVYRRDQLRSLNHDINRNRDWANDGKQYYEESDLADAVNFPQRSTEDALDDEENENDGVNIVDYNNSLNEKRQIIFKRIKSHYHDMLTRSQTKPLRIIVMGTAGIGKSYLMLREMTGNEAKNPLLILAPTGVAAFNIRGRTIHSALSLPICNSDNNLDLNGE